MQLTPIKKNVLIAENKSEVKSESGIILEGAFSAMDSKTGTVGAIGKDVLDISVGDTVLVEWNKGAVVTVDGAQRVMIDEKFIAAVIG